MTNSQLIFVDLLKKYKKFKFFNYLFCLNSFRDLEFNGNIISSSDVHNSFMSALMRFATVMNIESFIETN